MRPAPPSLGCPPAVYRAASPAPGTHFPTYPTAAGGGGSGANLWLGNRAERSGPVASPLPRQRSTARKSHALRVRTGVDNQEVEEWCKYSTPFNSVAFGVPRVSGLGTQINGSTWPRDTRENNWTAINPDWYAMYTFKHGVRLYLINAPLSFLLKRVLHSVSTR